ncbi:L-threonylcarbamoyladenylate synthase [Hyphococcus luteus]|uniref:Threonylcarbamoyl-AMP synthase n=1 Tax=Hyphococcus luteus TaxID=2058213 RepID=A0A2S7K5D7_9PROT|nr:L-threonylcarbamoyladenylate synthase [Marinicaulis flavus]PQA87724.1 threonylcarbamoyl-AMP synthase [Marinicaulis flavus]
MTVLDHKDIKDAAAILRAGGLVAMPTETVYGLAADATNDQAVAKIFEAKGRPQFNPLIVHVAGPAMAKRYVAVPPLAEKLMAEFWPGPLTLVLPRKEDGKISLLVSAGLDTIGVRAPKHDLAQALIQSVDRALAAPSANRSGTISPTRADHVKDSLGDRVDMILDGGPSPVGVESTIVKIDGETVTLLRPGGIARADIERVIGCPLSSASGTIEAPGMMTSHYAPDANMRLDAREQKDGEAFLGFGAVKGDGPAALNLSESSDLAEAAANLFAYLREADRLAKTNGLKTIAVANVPMEGLGEAINDRLKRAAAPKA